MDRRPRRSRPSRRRLLGAGAALVTAGLAGCSGGGDGDSGGATGGSDATPAATIESAASETIGGREADVTRSAGADLDLREANVVGVEVEPRDGTAEFSVTLHHDDDGEDGYADWWQVETVEGERLGRRELLHAHGTSPFTRSEGIELPADVACVVVRGHDRTHGYGGQAMLVDVETEATAAVRQGSSREPVDPAACP